MKSFPEPAKHFLKSPEGRSFEVPQGYKTLSEFKKVLELNNKVTAIVGSKERKKMLERKKRENVALIAELNLCGVE